MGSNKNKKLFQGMTYRELQKYNSQNRIKLSLEDQKCLKENGYKNIGWDYVINLYNTIQDFLVKYQVEDLTYPLNISGSGVIRASMNKQSD